MGAFLCVRGIMILAHEAISTHPNVPSGSMNGWRLRYSKLVPLPEVAVYIQQSQSVLVERTTKRGHKRIKDRSQANTQIFVKRAVETFNTIVQQLVCQGKLSVVDNQRNIFAAPDYQNSASTNAAIDVIRSGIDSILVKRPT